MNHWTYRRIKECSFVCLFFVCFLFVFCLFFVCFCLFLFVFVCFCLFFVCFCLFCLCFVLFICLFVCFRTLVKGRGKYLCRERSKRKHLLLCIPYVHCRGRHGAFPHEKNFGNLKPPLKGNSGKLSVIFLHVEFLPHKTLKETLIKYHLVIKVVDPLFLSPGGIQSGKYASMATALGPSTVQVPGAPVPAGDGSSE